MKVFSKTKWSRARHVASVTLGCILALFASLAPVSAQEVTQVTGTVTEADTGEPISGVSVVVQGTGSGVTTGSNGTFSIGPVSVGDVLVFSFVGFQSVTVEVVSADMGALDISMMVDVLEVGDLVVVGSRRFPRLVTDSPVPVDVISARDLETSSSIDIDEILRTQIPSYNVQRHEIDGSTTFVRPATLRGLSPDNLIVLVNGKRRHRSASVALFGSSLNEGAQGADLNMIPSIALQQVEVLRDGSSAQYGADAVAGVLNFRLRDARRGVTARAQAGQYYQGDGEYMRYGVNAGLPLTSNGFINLSLEYRDTAPTIRSAQRADAETLTARGFPVKNPTQIWGSPDIDNAWVSFVNAGVDLTQSVSAYAFGGYAQHRGEGGYYFRVPSGGTARSNVYRIGSRRAIADLDTQDDVECSQLSDLPSLDADFSEVEAFVNAHKGDCFLFNEMFPGGFTPRFGADISDMSGVVGVRSRGAGKLQWDLSAGFGRSQLEYFIFNTVNASYGPESPTSFRQRDFLQEEVSVNLGMSYPVSTSFLHSPINVAWGADWRQETFETVAGDKYANSVGPYALQGFSVGANGDPGIGPGEAGRWSRPNYALYADLEADVTSKLLLGVAARYEDFYTTFGSSLNGKVSFHYQAAPRVALRGSAHTGFRSPNPAQANVTIRQTDFSGDGNLVDAAQLPPYHAVSMAYGAQELKHETARNLAAGAVLEFSNGMVLTVDYFRIFIDDRIALTGQIDLTDEVQEIIAADGTLSGFGTLNTVKFYSNDFDTRTQGIDVLLHWDKQWADGRSSNLSVAWNWTATKLVDYSRPQKINSFLGVTLQKPVDLNLLTPRRLVEMESLNPKNRVVISGRHMIGNLHGMLRLNYYDGWTACRFQGNHPCTTAQSPNAPAPEQFGSQWLVGMEVGYRIGLDYQIAVGVDNLFDTVPDAPIEETNGQGNLVPTTTPWDNNGGAMYIRLTASL